MTSARDNFKAGVFVLLGMILLLIVVFALSDLEGLFQPKQVVVVELKLSDGLQGLKEGAQVTLGDEPVGTVVQIDDVAEAGTERLIAKRVTFSVPKAIRLYQNALIELKSPLIGTGTKLNIRNVGDGERYRADMVIQGGLSPNQVAAQFVKELGIRDQQRAELAAIIANVASITQTLRDELPQIAAKLRSVLDHASQLSKDAVTAMGDLRQASAHIKSLLGEVHERRVQWLDHVDSIASTADQTLTRVNRLVADKDEPLRQTIDDVSIIAQQIRKETLVQVRQALQQGRTALENFKVSIEEVKSLIVGQRPVIERAIANSQITTDQLKLAAIEVRRSPWRLLYRPDEKELTTDNIYDAARSFSLAASALDSTARTLRAVTSDPLADADEIQKVLNYLEALFGKFKQAEEAFWQALGR